MCPLSLGPRIEGLSQVGPVAAKVKAAGIEKGRVE